MLAMAAVATTCTCHLVPAGPGAAASWPLRLSLTGLFIHSDSYGWRQRAASGGQPPGELVKWTPGARAQIQQRFRPTCVLPGE